MNNRLGLTVLRAGLLIVMGPLVARAADPTSVIEQYGLEAANTPVSERPGWRKPRRILVNAVTPELVDALRSVAPGVEIITAGNAEVASKMADLDALIGFCSPQLFASGKSIQWVHLFSAGVEQCVAVPAVRERNILVTNTQRIGGPIIAEHAMAMLLALTRGLDVFIPAQANGEWRRGAPPPGRMMVVKGKTMLVVGLGGIGTEVAQRAHAMGMKVIATRASGRTGPDFVSYVGLADELTTLAAQADVVVNAAPLTPQTKGMFDAAFFAKVKSGAYFINIARGGSVVTDALVAALKSGRVAGAGLDVTDPEPLPAQHPLWKTPNVIITPHIANDSDLGEGARIAVAQENLRRYVAGEKMLSVVDVARGY